MSIVDATLGLRRITSSQSSTWEAFGAPTPELASVMDRAHEGLAADCLVATESPDTLVHCGKLLSLQRHAIVTTNHRRMQRSVKSPTLVEFDLRAQQSDLYPPRK